MQVTNAGCRACRCQRATLLGKSDLALGGCAVQRDDAWRMGLERGQVGSQRAVVAAGDRARQCGTDAECTGVSERALDQRPIDRQRPGLVQAGHPAELGDRVEECDEPARREDRGGVVGGLRARREPDGTRADPFRHLGQQRQQLIVAFDGHGRPVERGDCPLGVGEGNQRVERPDLRPGGLGRFEDLGTERAAGVDHRLAAVHPDRAASGASASSGTARMMSSTSSTRAWASMNARSTVTRPRNRSRRLASRLATAWIGQPARDSATPSAVPTAPAPTIPVTGG